jgi:hypothetical protein
MILLTGFPHCKDQKNSVVLISSFLCLIFLCFTSKNSGEISTWFVFFFVILPHSWYGIHKIFDILIQKMKKIIFIFVETPSK